MQKSKEEIDDLDGLQASFDAGYDAGYSAAQDEIKLLRAKLEKAVSQRNNEIAKRKGLSADDKLQQIEIANKALNALTLETIGE